MHNFKYDASLNHRRKMKAELSLLIPRKLSFQYDIRLVCITYTSSEKEEASDLPQLGVRFPC